jgi:hypothetical protein
VFPLESFAFCWTNEDALEEADIERAGLEGLAGAKVDGEAGNAPEDDCFVIGGAVVLTGVAFGVVCCDETDVLMAETVG